MRYFLALLVGAILGGLLVFFLFVGVPRTTPLPASTTQTPEAASTTETGTAVLTLDETFFNTLLGTIFRDLGDITFQLAKVETDSEGTEAGASFVRTQGACPSRVVLAQEASGVRTGVRFVDNRIIAPLAFSGSYALPIGPCINFRGTGQANIQLAFDPAKQNLYGQINVEGLNLENMSPAFSGLVALFVKRAIDERVNPLEVLRGSQLTLAVPVQASNGTLRAQVKDVRAEVTDVLRLHVIYDFSGVRAGGPPSLPPPPQS
ncbi:MAG: hypothetical protein H0T92_11260 [Pyrinomonadaceae bacterium]|nr:hypothetical protein [Pyrinomonadaceae bacterium]